ncbi:MAG: Zn-dependent oligopeptidase [Planctomycetes bacterium]|nr:Zn-dependent oligopeptidase [Planctomycetota bacterium]
MPHPRARTAALRCFRIGLPLALAGLSASAALAQEIPADSPVAEALRRAEQTVQAIVAVADDARTFDNTLGAIDDFVAQLELDTNMTQFMQFVSSDEQERQRAQVAQQHVENWLIDLSKREDLYNAVRAYAATEPRLEGEQKRFLEHTLRDYRRAGMDLAPDQRDELKRIQKELSRLGIAFDKNIREDETRVILTPDELADMRPEWLETQTQTAGVYLLGMDYPTLNEILDNCPNETTRKKYWLAFKRRGGKQNVGVLEQILKLRAQAAALLGYAHPADYETEVRMAKNAKTVFDFYKKLRPLVRKKAERDFAEFVQAKREHTGDPSATLRPWDFSFYDDRLKKTRYSVDAQKVQEYFPLERVIDGLFGITQSLYGIEYRDVTARAGSGERPLWHKDVKLYEVIDNQSGKTLGEFYLDLHPRENKYGHAAQWGLAQHKVWSDGRLTRPLAALVCNFTKPTDEKPSLLRHSEVETFFHEFGHCLHTILSEATLFGLAGTGVARDFVEAPSQMFENWVWDAKVLSTFARHYKTDEPLPADLLEGMIQARYLGSGLLAEHQFYYGLMDMKCHTTPKGELDTIQAALDLYEEVELYDAVPETYYHAGFGHFVGYQAGYYGYMWSQVYAADMFQRFKELGMLNPEAGRYYRQKILARGGTMDALDMVKDYLGREPNMRAFLKHLGLDEE